MAKEVKQKYLVVDEDRYPIILLSSFKNVFIKSNLEEKKDDEEQ